MTIDLLHEPLTRARWLRLAAAGALGWALPGRPRAAASQAPASPPAGAAMKTMTTRPIPSTGEALPVVGCGTYVGFDVEAGSEAYARLPGVVQALFDAGGSVIDSSPMYGRAEADADAPSPSAARRAATGAPPHDDRPAA